MSKMSELSVLIGELRNTASALNAIADGLNDLFSADEPAHSTVQQSENAKVETFKAEPTVPVKVIALEEVRAVLAKKSSEGNGTKVQELIHKYGVSKLSQIDPVHYSELLQAAEVM